MTLPPCPWCKQPATVRLCALSGGWVAGCNNPTRASGPATDYPVCPNTTPMTSPRAAVRAWMAAFRRMEASSADNFTLIAKHDERQELLKPIYR